MKISNAGGIIAAANKKLAFPLSKVGSISAIKRIVMIFREAGIFPIVVMTGAYEDEVRYELAASGVVFLPTREEKEEGMAQEENRGEPELIDSARTGIRFLRDHCRRIVFAPVNIPYFSRQTLHALLKCEGPIVIPTYKNRGGHPIVIDWTVNQTILAYTGEGGLRGVIKQMENEVVKAEVKDEGILHHSKKEDETYPIDTLDFGPYLHIGIEQEYPFFDSRMKLLLYLISHTKSVKSACNMMALSYSKAWDAINKLEAVLGIRVINRKHGGSRGGQSALTEEGIHFLYKYQRFEEELIQSGNDAFSKLIKETNTTT